MESHASPHLLARTPRERLTALVNAGKLTPEQASLIQFREIPPAVRERALEISQEASAKWDRFLEDLQALEQRNPAHRLPLHELEKGPTLGPVMLAQLDQMGAPVADGKFSPGELRVWLSANRARFGAFATPAEEGSPI